MTLRGDDDFRIFSASILHPPVLEEHEHDHAPVPRESRSKVRSFANWFLETVRGQAVGKDML